MKKRVIAQSELGTRTQHSPILEMDTTKINPYMKDKVKFKQPGENLLLNMFEENNLNPGDTLRILDKQGNLFDISYTTNEQNVIVQNLELKVQYGKSQKFKSWDDALEALPDKEFTAYDPHVGIETTLPESNKETEKETEKDNPYEKGAKCKLSEPILPGLSLI